MKLSISQECDHFQCGGKSFFYLADTVWSAFTNATITEWEEYLDYRKTQNFNALQINILAQHDASSNDLNIWPFEKKTGGQYDYFKINEAYFKKAEKMVRMAVDKGFIPALVVLWGNFVPDTFQSRNHPEHIMPIEVVEPYIRYVSKVFCKYEPVFIISGDTDFQSDRTVDYYMTALKAVKTCCPEALTTMHLTPDIFHTYQNGRDLPEVFRKCRDLDFFMYQSGHDITKQYRAYEMAQDCYKYEVKKPIVNGEPCYEGMGYNGRYGRFNSFDIRKALWQSLLSGAKAGITYGAHGIWSWHMPGMNFTGAAYFDIPFHWRTALRLKGAWDAGFARWIFEYYNLFDLEPGQRILNKTEEIRMATNPGDEKIVIYVPYVTDIHVPIDLNSYNWTLINLEEKQFGKPDIVIDAGTSVIKMPQSNSDMLLLGIME